MEPTVPTEVEMARVRARLDASERPGLDRLASPTPPVPAPHRRRVVVTGTTPTERARLRRRFEVGRSALVAAGHLHPPVAPACARCGAAHPPAYDCFGAPVVTYDAWARSGRAVGR